MTMTLEKAIKILKVNYESAIMLPFVRSPLAWALYRTWEEVDKKERHGK